MSYCLYDPSVQWCQHKVCYEARTDPNAPETPGQWVFTPLSPTPEPPKPERKRR